jgi:hypothetical protein
LDSLPPPPPPQVAPSAPVPSSEPVPSASADASGGARYGFAPGDIYPRGSEEAELCASASTPDWAYLLGLGVLDAGAILYGSSDFIKNVDRIGIRFTGPALIGLTWGATVGGSWLSLPKCSMHWVGESPREGGVRQVWPLALSFALLAGATAPIVNRIADGSEPMAWTDLEREMHVVTAGVFGFAGAFLPYLVPPKTWAAAREIDRLRVSASAQGAFIGYVGTF